MAAVTPAERSQLWGWHGPQEVPVPTGLPSGGNLSGVQDRSVTLGLDSRPRKGELCAHDWGSHFTRADRWLLLLTSRVDVGVQRLVCSLLKTQALYGHPQAISSLPGTERS